ncbi:hypothetical protein [Longitalea luteola]|uniref:hypothetical protein n=1 Tax=Longitalea luteola TaxID=2812563 RepID=UPI001A956B67|nr:hypothetical protein [Longitalea luteola]
MKFSYLLPVTSCRGTNQWQAEYLQTCCIKDLVTGNRKPVTTPFTIAHLPSTIQQTFL